MLSASFLEWWRGRRSSRRSVVPTLSRRIGPVWSFTTGFGKVQLLTFDHSIALALRVSLELASRPIHLAW